MMFARDKSDRQRRAMFANMGKGVNRNFRLTGPSSRAHRNRSVLYAGAGGLAVGGALLARNKIRLLRPLIETMGGRKKGLPASNSEKYYHWSTQRQVYGGNEKWGIDADPGHDLLQNPALAPLARRLWGAHDEGGAEVFESVPLVTRKAKGFLDQEVKRPARLLADTPIDPMNPDAAFKMRRRDLWADRVERNASLWKAGGKNRVFEAVENAEKGVKRAGGRLITKGRRLLTESNIPDVELDKAATAFRHKYRDEIKTEMFRTRLALQESGQRARPQDVARIVRRYAREQARVDLEPKYPSPVKKVAERIVRPARQRVVAANRRLNDAAVNFGRRRGLPVDEVGG
jgi:hypothetical protein